MGYRQFPRVILRMIEIGPAVKIVFCDLLSRIQEYGNGRCFPAIDTVAAENGLSRRTVQRALRDLMARSHRRDDRLIDSPLDTPFLARARTGRKTFDYILDIPKWVLEKYGQRDWLKQQTVFFKSDIKGYLRKREDGKCGYCGRDLGDRWEADHIIPKSRGGTDDPENLVAACLKCNREKGTRTADEFGYPNLAEEIASKMRGVKVSYKEPGRRGKVTLLRDANVSNELEGRGVRRSRELESARPSVGQAPRPLPSSLRDSADKAVNLSNQVRAKKESAQRKWNKGMEVEKANWKANINSWRGQKFYEYMAHLCQRYQVPLSDPIELATGVPDKLARAMNDVLVLLHNRDIDNAHWARILERLIEGWTTGGSDILGKHGKLSVYGFRYKIDEVLAIFRDPKPSSSPRPESGVKDVMAHISRQEKKEE